MSRPFGPVTGVRQLSRVRSNRAVTVTLGTPRPGSRGAEWECPFRIDGLRLRSRRVQYGYGIDSMEALTTALEGIRVTLAEHGARLSWVGGSPGDVGFARCVPEFSPQLFARLNRVIDREAERLVREQARRRARRAKPSS